MYLIQLTYTVPLKELDKHLQAHRSFLADYYAQGLLVMSGPLNPRTCGLIIAVHMPRDQLETIIQQDPFYQAKVATYQIQEFSPIKHCSALKELIQSTEPSLC